MLWTDIALKVDGADVVDLRPAWLPVDRALVQLVVPSRRRVDRINVDHWHWLIEHLWGEQNIAGDNHKKASHTLGLASTSLPVFLSRLAPSRKRPWMKTPWWEFFSNKNTFFCDNGRL